MLSAGGRVVPTLVMVVSALQVEYFLRHLIVGARTHVYDDELNVQPKELARCSRPL